MNSLRSILADRSSAHAVLALAVLLLLLQTVFSAAAGVATVAAATGTEARFIICAPSVPGGVVEVANAEPTADFHCPLCRIDAIAVVPEAIETVDLGPAFSLATTDFGSTGQVVETVPTLFTHGLAPDRTGPPIVQR